MTQLSISYSYCRAMLPPLLLMVLVTTTHQRTQLFVTSLLVDLPRHQHSTSRRIVWPKRHHHHQTKCSITILSSSRKYAAWSEVLQNAMGNFDKRLERHHDRREQHWRQRRRRRERINNNNNNNNSNSGKSRIEFVVPLLEDGYPPTVMEYEKQQLLLSSSLSRTTRRRYYEPESTKNTKMGRKKNITNKPMLLYLPGFDGTIVAPFLQFPSLGEEFDVRAMKVDMEDRSTFEELKEAVVDYIMSECKRRTMDRNGEDEEDDDVEEEKVYSADNFDDELGVVVIYLMGESFGGILAIEIALELNKQTYRGDVEVRGLILVNPATSYLRSALYELGPPIANATPILPALRDSQYVASLITKLVPLFLDKGKAMQQLITILSSKGLPSVVNSPQREAYMGRVAFDLPNRLKFMPKDTLKWRLEEWLEWGCAVFEDRLEMLHSARHVADDSSSTTTTTLDIESSYSLLKLSQEMRTLIVVGEFDLTLPSIDEASRLSTDVFRNARVHVVPGAGHASTCGGSLNLMNLIREVYPEINVVKRRGQQWRTSYRLIDDGMNEDSTELHGLEPRYDNASVGLNPLLYWSKEHYRKRK